MPLNPDPNTNYDLFTKPIYLFAGLPAAANNPGVTVWISDLSTAPVTTAGATAVGGGTFFGKVRSDGTSWKIVNPAGSL